MIYTTLYHSYVRFFNNLNFDLRNNSIYTYVDVQRMTRPFHLIVFGCYNNKLCIQIKATRKKKCYKKHNNKF